jgi:hypothetical protein
MCTTLQIPMTIAEQRMSFAFGGMGKSTVTTSPAHALLPFSRNPTFVQDGADMNLIIERSANACAKAIEKTRRKFARYTLITRVKEIPIEQRGQFASNICTIPNVFLAYIRRFHNYRGRHNVFLQASFFCNELCY